jgi:dephospho-CoA kinase
VSRRPFLVGLTGGIGSGKSTVADLFANLGAKIIDADLIAHQLTAPDGLAIDAIRGAFGPQLISADGSLDRPSMRSLVFADDSQRVKLEAILHPLIRSQTERAIVASNTPYVMLVIPLLFESPNWRARVQRAVVVDCSEEMQISRVMQRSSMARHEVLAIMAKQVSRQERLAVADDVIDNSGDQHSLNAIVVQLHRRYLKLATQTSGL